MTTDDGFRSGAIVAVKEEGHGNYVVTQYPTHVTAPPRSGNRIPFDWSWGPISVSGYIDLGDGALSVTATVAGISLGTFTGSLKDGIKIDVNLFVAKGSLKFYIEGSTLYLDASISITFDGEYKKDHIKIISW